MVDENPLPLRFYAPSCTGKAISHSIIIHRKKMCIYGAFLRLPIVLLCNQGDRATFAQATSIVPPGLFFLGMGPPKCRLLIGYACYCYFYSNSISISISISNCYCSVLTD